jgi:hypothetical protein
LRVMRLVIVGADTNVVLLPPFKVVAIVYAVVPEVSVTTVVMVFAPRERAKAVDVAPEATAVPFTVMVVVGLVAVGVTMTDVAVPRLSKV